MSILKERSTLRRGARLAAAILLLAAVPAAAQDGASTRTADSTATQAAVQNGAGTASNASVALKPTGAAAVAELRVDSASPGNALLGHRVRVRVQNLDTLIGEGRIDPDKLVLFINGRAVADAVGRRVGYTGNEMEFALAYTGPSSQAWLAAFDEVRDGRGQVRGRVRVGVGYANGLEAPPARAGAPVIIQFQPYSEFRFNATLWGLVLALGLFGWLVVRSGVLRDSADESGVPVQQRPFSLGRTQAAAWFFAVFASFLYIRLVTLNYNSLNAEALFLLGLGVATQAGAGLVDTSRRTRARATLAELGPQLAETEVQVAEMTAREGQLGANADPAARMQLGATRAATAVKLDAARVQAKAAEAELKGAPSQNFLLDLVSDGEGVSLHRFQMAAWTAVLIGVYLTEVYQSLAMPVLGATLLGLMGLSSATYVGLKSNERPSTPDKPAQNAAGASAPADAMRSTVDTTALTGLGDKPTPVGSP